MTALCLGGLLVSLDGTILGTAVPAITAEFGSLGDVGWYNSVYLLTMSVPQLLFGKLNSRYPVRWNHSAAMLLFVVGSAVCGAAPSSAGLIAGRAIAGLGCSGLLVSTMSLAPVLAPPARQPLLIGMFAATMGLGIAIGPLVGGVLTETVSWRWNFYINLPFAAVIYAVFLWLVPSPSNPIARTTTPTHSSFWQTLDPLGLTTLTASVTSLLLALQWGGVQYPWNDARITALLVLSGVLSLVFLCVEVWQRENAMLPASIFTQRSVVCSALFSFCSSGASVVLVYYLPSWFQGVMGVNALQSGVNTLPLVMTTVFTTAAGGLLLTHVGQVGTLMLVATVFMSIGAGLFTTFKFDSPTSYWIGCQIVYGLGNGFSRQAPAIAVQKVLAESDMPIGFGMIMFSQFMGGAIFIPIAQAIFINKLAGGLQSLGLHAVDPATLAAEGLTTITAGLEGQVKDAALTVINNSLVQAWHVSVGLACAGIIGVVFVEHGRINRKPKNL
ncbi:major facilitator superfamily domain-containing protein [Microdochium trichocladiopsis]|uniref:Major facilitator superfamily domain-containing protein n=1 Tax=Microdochium trichocladiopsis TaxID=1682393 RepID=A0A9P9BMZ5_9PEZI|nr:major facilitator superfamily domain-containing protein [Microdochium trichocladiopsis]KAH7027191.1 major facilitator superfamily domain-containing protein [Microdochium trichocladiopsis]